MKSRGQKRGFTIIELLIVVVVIAILASIVIVAFSGIQQKARNTARIDTTKAILTSMQMYEAQNGAGSLLPLMTLDGTGVCIGNSAEDVDPTEAYSCRYTEFSTPVMTSSAAVNQALYDALQTVAQYRLQYTPVVQENFSNIKKVTASSPFVVGNEYATSGVRYTLDGGAQQDHYVLMSYRLEGNNQDCTLPVVRQDPVTDGVLNFTSGHLYSAVNGGATECWVWLAW